MRTTVLALLFSLVLAPACAERPSRPGDRPATTAVAGPAAHAAVELPPFSLSLEGDVADDGTVTLDAAIRVHWAVPAPLTVTVTLPRGARLAEGDGDETIAAPRAGAVIARRFRVADAAGREVRVTAAQQLPDRVGATATRSWPPAATAAPREWEPIAPVRHGSIEVREAIRLAPGPPR